MLRVGIVGGGVSGLAAAVALQQVGHDAQLFERAGAIREVGSGLTLWANATKVLDALGVFAACFAKAQKIDTFDLRTAAGRVVMSIPVEAFATPPMAMHRADLQAAFVQEIARHRLHVDQRCLGATETPDGVFLQLASGEQGPFDLILGADGVHSALRAFVERTPRPLSYRGYTIWRGVATGVDAVAAPGLISETWGLGQRFGILPLGGGRVCWYATANAKVPFSTASETRQAYLQQLFRGWHTPVQQLIAQTPALGILEHATYDRAVSRGWSRGRVTLLGDAAHPLTPNLGQGACLALEDAVVLARLLAAVEPHEVAAALRRFEQLRFARVQAMARRCRWLGALGQWEHPLLNHLRIGVAALLPGRLFTHTSRQIQAYAADETPAYRHS